MRRRTDKLAVVCTALCILCVAVVAVGGWTVIDTSRRTERNSATVAQVCDLVMNTHTDRFKRYTTTLDYLNTPGGDRGLKDYIRNKSLPQTRDEVVKERKSLPPTCVARYERTTRERLPEIPQLPK